MSFEKKILEAILNGSVHDVSVFIEDNCNELKKDVDKYREYFLKEPLWAFTYSNVVDEDVRIDTYMAVKGSKYEKEYFENSVDLAVALLNEVLDKCH